MLQIRLSKGVGPASPELGANGKPISIPRSDNVTVSCPEHLVLADLLVAKGAGAVANVKVIKTIGRKRRRRPGEKVHICLCCNFPIAIYGRLSPCEHAFCLTCARSEPSCYLCDERIQKIQTIKMLDGIFICGAPHCWRSFLKRDDFEQHLKEVHLDLLQPLDETEEAHQKDVKQTIPETQNKQPHADSQVLCRSVSAPARPTLEPPMLTSSKSVPVLPMTSPPEKQHQHIQSTGLLVSPVTSPPEKQLQAIQLIGTSVSPVISPPEKQQQQNQSTGLLSGRKRHDQQAEQKQSSYQQHFDNQVNTSAGPQQQSQVKNQVIEKHPSQSQSLKDFYHGQPQGEIQHMHSEMLQIPHSGNQYSQPQEKQQTDGFYQHNLPYQTLLQRPPPAPPANPPFPNYPFSHSYPILPEGQPQHLNPHFDPRFGHAMDEVAIQASMQSMQESNQRMHIQTPIIPEVQDNSNMAHTLGTSVLSHDGTSTMPGPQERYIQERSGPFSNIQGDLGQIPTGMSMQLPPQGTGMGFNQSLHYQDVTHAPEMPPLPKHRKYQNNPVHGESTTNYGWDGGQTNFAGHGYGSWSGPQSHG